MNPFVHNSGGKNNWTWVFIVVGLIALHNQHLIKTDPESTYPKRIRRALRLWINPAETELEKHLIGKGIKCEEPAHLYQKVAAATVVEITAMATVPRANPAKTRSVTSARKMANPVASPVASPAVGSAESRAANKAANAPRKQLRPRVFPTGRDPGYPLPDRY